MFNSSLASGHCKPSLDYGGEECCPSQHEAPESQGCYFLSLQALPFSLSSICYRATSLESVQMWNLFSSQWERVSGLQTLRWPGWLSTGRASQALSFFLPVSWCLLVLGAASICSWNGLNFHLEGRAVLLSGLLVSKETESFPAWAQPLEF